MTLDEDLLNNEENDKTDENQENENDRQILNEAYDRVSSSGKIPSLDDYFNTGQELGDPFSISDTQGGVGKNLGDPEFSSFRFNDDGVNYENEEENQTEEPEAGKLQEPETFNLKSIIDGSFFVQERFSKIFPFILFLVAIAIVYISNRNIAESLIKRNIVLRQEVRELKAESITIAAELMNISKETEIAKRIAQKQLGIYEQKEPPKIFVIEKFKRADSLKTSVNKKDKNANYFKDFEDEFKK
ncbi:MAG: hypothetical protein IIU11_02800 [Bacteroidales bacterium]|nr:hypothetical protein [Bacteroidales bacterium]